MSCVQSKSALRVIYFRKELRLKRHSEVALKAERDILFGDMLREQNKKCAAVTRGAPTI